MVGMGGAMGRSTRVWAGASGRGHAVPSGIDARVHGVRHRIANRTGLLKHSEPNFAMFIHHRLTTTLTFTVCTAEPPTTTFTGIAYVPGAAFGEALPHPPMPATASMLKTISIRLTPLRRSATLARREQQSKIPPMAPARLRGGTPLCRWKGAAFHAVTLGPVWTVSVLLPLVTAEDSVWRAERSCR